MLTGRAGDGEGGGNGPQHPAAIEAGHDYGDSPDNRSPRITVTAGIILLGVSVVLAGIWWLARHVIQWTGAFDSAWSLMLASACLGAWYGLTLLAVSSTVPGGLRLVSAAMAVAVAVVGAVLAVMLLFLSPIAAARNTQPWVFNADGSRAVMLDREYMLLGEPCWAVVEIRPGLVSRVGEVHHLIRCDRTSSSPPPPVVFVDADTVRVGKRDFVLS